MEIDEAEFAMAALVVVVAQDGSYKWSSDKTDIETANALESIAEGIRGSQ